MRKTEDEDDQFTFRRVERLAPSSQLEEVLSATILRVAKEKFQARLMEDDEKPSPTSSLGVEANINNEPLTSENESLDMDLDEALSATSKTSKKTRETFQGEQTFQPAVATDDDLSYSLIRPSTRALLAKLDQTLTILHNARMTSAETLLDSKMGYLSASEQEDDEARFDEATPTRRSSRSRSRFRAHSPSSSLAPSPSGTSTRNSTPGNPMFTVERKTNFGRPMKYVPKEGESERDFLIRRARALKLKIPVFSDEEEGGAKSMAVNRTTPKQAIYTPATLNKATRRGRPSIHVPREGETEREFLIRRAKEQKKKRPVFADDEADGGITTAAEGGPETPPRQKGSRRRRGSSSSLSPAGGRTWMRERLQRLRPRDWSDVMGAAALAGFAPEVVARATQRCADLFGEEMDMRTITAEGHEKTRRYIPGGGDVDDNDDDDDSSESSESEEEVGIRRARSASRARSVAARTPSTRKRQRRSSSQGPVFGNYCPYMDCDRAIRGFARPWHLKRHLKLVHGEDIESATPREISPDKGKAAATAVPKRTPKGGVHKDGFLVPIMMQKGWRADDARKRADRRTSRKRRRDESSEEESEDSSGSASLESESGVESAESESES